jgi:hypothetical protein
MPAKMRRTLTHTAAWNKLGTLESVRVKLDTFPLSNDVGLLNRYEPFGQREYIVFLRQSDHKIVFNIDAGDGVHAAGVASGTAASLGTWYHVAGGWDGANIELAVNNGIFVTAAYSRAMINGGHNLKQGMGRSLSTARWTSSVSGSVAALHNRSRTTLQ